MKTIESKDILQIFDVLPSDKKKEVYDFVEFLKNRTEREKVRKKGFIKRIYGSTKGSRLTAEQFSKMKVEDITLEDKQ
jgi:hypothetical protein